MIDKKNKVYSAEKAGSLDGRIRRLLFNPRKMLGPYVKEGMTVLDVGCGPGFFTIPLAQMVGDTGRVIAADLQEEMLDRVRAKIKGADLEKRISLHKCEADRIGFSEKTDLILLFYMVHEVPQKEAFFKELRSILKPNGSILMVEPPFRVSRKDFEETIKEANTGGLRVVERPQMFFNKVVALKKV